jgi:exonuclease III
MVKILSWNILQGGGHRVLKIIQAITTLKPNICVLSEFRNNDNGDQLRYGLLKAGYRFQFVSDALPDNNSVMIVSNIACSSQLFPKSDNIYSGNIISVHFEVFSIIGVYLPHKKKHTLFDYIHTLIGSSQIPYLITGDFNAGINHVDQVGDSFWYEDELKAFEKFQYFDIFRHVHGQVKEYSWFSHQGNGYRYDHTYGHKNLLPVIRECIYLHDWRIQKLSDHAPMLIKLG